MALDRCLPELLASGAITPEQADEARSLFGELEQVFRRQFGDQAAGAMASTAAVKALRIQAAQKKRVTLLQMAAQRQALVDMQGFAGGGPGGPIDPRAAIALLDQDGRASYSNVEARRKAIKGRAHGLVETILARHHRNLVGEIRHKAELVNVVRELFKPGSTADPNARALAEAWTRAAEMLRGRFNAAGGHIAALEQWGLPQAHDGRAVDAAGFRQWRDFTIELLDRGRMIDDRTGLPFSDQALEVTLRDVWQTIRTDGWSKIAVGAQSGRMLANQRAEHRFLHFKDGDAWLAYAERFGTGSPFDAMMGHIEAMSRDIAAMEILGPNPDATITWLKDSVVKSAQLYEGPDGLAIRARADAAPKKIDRIWSEYTGELRRPESRRIALVFGTIRAVQTSAKLGSAILSAVGDLAMGRLTRRFNGLPARHMITEYVRLFRPGSIEDQRQAVRSGLIAEEWSHMAGAQHRFLLEELTGEVARRLATGTIRLSGLSRFTQSGRWAFGMELLGFLTNNMSRRFDQLPDAMQRQMRANGIGPDGWEAIRATPVELERGVPWLFPRNVENRLLGDRLLEWIHSEADFAVPVPDLRTRSLIHYHAPAGTIMGEVARSALLFKSFGISMLLLHGRRMMEQAGPNRARYAAGLVIGATLMGAVAVQLKLIQKGLDPRDPTGDGDAGQALAFWGAAAAQGGGFGIFGDFLASSENRFGGGFASTLAGPTVDTAQGIADLTLGNAFKAARGDKTDVGRDAVRLIKSETPGGSLWYARLALERLLFDQLGEAVDPDYHKSVRRMERRAREQGTDYWWRPGEGEPERAPDMAAAVGQ